MIPNPKFTKQEKNFWAYVRTVSQDLGYTKKRKRNGPPPEILVPDINELRASLHKLQLSDAQVFLKGSITPFGQLIIDYFEYRARAITKEIRPHLLKADEAKALYLDTKARLRPIHPPPMNKQKGSKKAPAYLTAMANMILEANSEGLPYNLDPRELTSVTKNSFPVRTLARRVDGAFPSVINPAAIWEIKEYYYTTTFGSRVADGVYESLLDGLELEEIRLTEDIDVKHYFIFDGYDTWWLQGRSYLCRIVDMLHMGYVDEILVGKEVVSRLPHLVKQWVEDHRQTAGKEPHPTIKA